MHSIERYGIVALLFLIVTVVAVLMWDGGKKQKGALPSDNPAPLVEAAKPHAIEPANRLGLLAPARPGPLVRELEARANTPQAEPEALTADAEPLVTPGAEQKTGLPLTAGQTPLTAPKEQPAPEQRPIASVPSARSYVVKSGETLSEIAQRELGSARRWTEITALNPGLDPAKLRAGKSIQLPGGEKVAASGGKPATTPRAESPAPSAGKETTVVAARSHKVARGENLWKIAESTLGDGKRWREIAALNPSVNPDKLVLGQVLQIPAASGAKKSQAAPVAASAKRNEPVVASNAGATPRRGSKVK